MFELKDVKASIDADELSGRFYVNPELACFKGHFDGQPLMPAAAQILLLSTILTSVSNWKVSLNGGKNIKFSQPIKPGDLLDIQVVKTNPTAAQFTIHKDDGSLVTKGQVMLVQAKGQRVSSGQICGLIPVYNNHMTIEAVVNLCRQYIDALIIVDDGSNDGTELIVAKLAANNPQIYVRHHTHNQGKGAAVQTGLKLAKDLGYDHALQVDADGQHNLDDIPGFLQARQKSPEAMIMGAPVFDESIPMIRKYGRKLTHLMIALEAGTTGLPDAMCGFRLYPVKPILKLGSMSSRMSFDPEVMIRAHWAGIPIKTITTKVRYLSAEEGGVSHFKMVHDNALHVWTHSRLLLQAPYRWFASWLRT